MTEETKLRKIIRLDARANRGNTKGLLLVLSFRLAHHARGDNRKSAPVWVWPIGVVYRLAIEWVLGCELPWNLKAGAGLVVYHGQGLVVNDGAVLGCGVTLRNGTTIGSAEHGGPCPRIGDGVQIGAGALVIGDICVGNGATIGAGSVVISDLPAGCTAVGNPARVIGLDQPERTA